MRLYHCLFPIQLVTLALLLAPTTLAFSSPPSSLRESARHRHQNCINHDNRLLATNTGDNNDTTENEVQPAAEYGVSYIGGDPCGSKYNDDPFDVQVTKPGMPDDMKARIQGLVDKKVAEEKAAEEASTNE